MLRVLRKHMADLYGITFAVETGEEDCDLSDFPEIAAASTDEQAVDFTKREMPIASLLYRLEIPRGVRKRPGVI